VLVEALERLQRDIPVKLILIGKGPLKSDLELAQAGNPNLILLPYRSDRSELASLLASADIYVTAGPYETFGISVLEAQASGLPVVGVRSGALIERVGPPVGPSVGILGEVDSPDDMARNVISIYDKGCRDIGRVARKMVEENYSWERTFRDISNLYSEALSEKWNHLNEPYSKSYDVATSSMISA
jgi:alpha-1,6-mannosyltransferase